MKINIAKYLRLSFYLMFFSAMASAQTSYKFHSHNDYLQEFPFWKAYVHGAASIEADVFLKNGKLYVTHSEEEVKEDFTLEALYLEPISKLAQKGELKELQLLIDFKSAAIPTLDKLVEVLKKYPELTGSKKLTLVISGNRPALEQYKNYPGFIKFDHQDINNLDKIDKSKTALISFNFRDYSIWNGMGRLTAGDLQKVEEVIKKAKATGKSIRFWGAPDMKTAWSRFAGMGVDFINTDHPAGASAYLNNLDNRTFKLNDTVAVYKPAFSYSEDEKPKNVILMIGDGNGIGQISAAMLANRGELTLAQLKHLGLLKTSSYDDLVTDSAAGGTAMATGEKTNNRAIGTGFNGGNLKNISEILSENNFITGIITTDNITGATPASFYAHVDERDNSSAILEDLKKSKIDFFLAAGAKDFTNIQPVFQQKQLPEEINFSEKSALYFSEKEEPGAAGNQFPEHVKGILSKLENQEKPYFIIIEGAKIDSYGHANNAAGIVREMLGFDKTIAEVLKLADKNKNTLVIITADHETGGFGIMQGNRKNGEIEGGFLTNDHTASMVPVFSYGPTSQTFTGIYENTQIFHRILKALELRAD